MSYLTVPEMFLRNMIVFYLIITFAFHLFIFEIFTNNFTKGNFY